MKSNQGSPFLKAGKKPYVRCAGPALLYDAFEGTPETLRELKTDEILELIEGPREEIVKSELVLFGKSGGVSGWLTARDAAGVVYAEKDASLFVCRAAIAMTDNFEIAKSEVLRKVDVGEALESVGGTKKDSEVEITRMQFKAIRDGKVGWITLRGNQGTTYVESAKEHYVVRKAAPFRKELARDSAVLSALQPGAVVDAKEAKEDSPPAKVGVKARALEDGTVGWVSISDGDSVLKPFFYPKK